MRLLYGKYFEARYQAIADEIPAGLSVVDVCAGDAYLFLKYLKWKQIDYLALDISPQMVAWALKQSVPAMQLNVRDKNLPVADVVVMQASLYQFLPPADQMIHKLLASARKRVIITEPIRNLADSNNRLASFLGRRLTVPEKSQGRYTAQRFNRESLTCLFESFTALERLAVLPGGREMIGVFKGQFSRTAL